MNERSATAPHHSVSNCPICEHGLAGIRVCGLPICHSERNHQAYSLHGLVVCDECEAIWTEPDTKTKHTYPDSEDARCPTCKESLWGVTSRWAGESDVKSLGWTSSIDRSLDLDVGDEQSDSGAEANESRDLT